MALNAQQQQDYADFLRRFEANPASISSEEAARRYRELTSLVSPAEAAEAHNQAFAVLAPENRRTLAWHFQDAHNDPNSAFDGYKFDNADQGADPHSLSRMTLQARQQDQSLLGSLLSSPLGKMAMAAAAAYLARKLFGDQQSSGTGQQPGLPDLGSILGALAQAQGSGQAGGGMPDLGSILSALGAAQSGGAQGGSASGAPAPGQPDLSSLLSGEGGQAGNSDLGRILTSLGGANPVPPQGEEKQDDKKS
jgi:hypothetical protein